MYQRYFIKLLTFKSETGGFIEFLIITFIVKILIVELFIVITSMSLKFSVTIWYNAIVHYCIGTLIINKNIKRLQKNI